MKARDDFTETTKRRLAERVAFRCSNPACGKATTGPHSNSEKSIRIGRAAHICAAASGGPRYSQGQSPTERASIQNAIWLCANCADLIDKDEHSFPEALLLEWKAQAEAFALKEIESSSGASVPAAVRLSVAKQLYTAFDLLAGVEGAKRITGLRPSSSDLEKVRRIVEDCESAAPRLEKVKWLKACYLLATGDVMQAFELSCSYQNPDEPERLLIQAQCLHKMGRAKEAIPLLNQLAGIEDLAATVFYNLGLAQDDCGQLSEAKASYEKALIKDPTYAYPHSRLGKLAYDSGNLEAAARHLRAACELEPKDEVLWLRWALVLLDLGEVGEAFKVLNSALERFPASSDLHGMMGRALGQAQMLDESEAAIRYSITLNAENATSWYSLAFCLMLKQRFTECRTALQKAIDHGYPDTKALERVDAMLAHYSSGISKEEQDANTDSVNRQRDD